MDSNYALLYALLFALVGWIATSYRIVHSQISLKTRRLLIIPLWFVWMAIAIGGPVVQGTVTIAEALNTSAGLSAGMGIFFAIKAVQSRRSR